MHKLNKCLRIATTACILTAITCTSSFALNLATISASSTLNFRETASTSSNVISKLPHGTKVAVLEQDNEWTKIAVNSQTGYVSTDFIKNYSSDEDFYIGNGVITGSTVNVRILPSTDTAILFQANKGASMDVIGISNGWFKVKSNTYIGFVHPDYITVSSRSASTSRGDINGENGTSAAASKISSIRQSIIDTAAKQIGKPYVYGSKGPNSFDCSGLTYYSYKQNGYTLASSSASQYTSTKRVSRDNLVVGDLLFFSSSSSGSRVGHVGIYVGNNQYIHAPSPGKSVCYSSLDSSWSRRHYIGGGRVIAN